MEENALHIDLDGAWPPGRLGLATADLREWGPRLRFSAPPRVIEQFYAEAAPRLRRFIIYGSGDFHHLSALWLRRVREPVTLVSFDNHPDWDIRPPAWCCGSWINRALDLHHVEHAAIWGCGNFECWGWSRLTGNHRDVRGGRLQVFPWTDRRSAADQAKQGSITRANWRDQFAAFAEQQSGRKLYITVDIDCLQTGEAVTNWENGYFTRDDLLWALGKLKERAAILAGDVCGAYSPPAYDRWKQRFAGNMDHPKLVLPEPAAIESTNLAAFHTIWPALTGGD